MKKGLFTIMCLALMGFISSTASAAELLDVKPIVAGSSVTVEVSADIPMTYTYYKVPGQARAVIDVAEADPEKVEPLIVVNKGAVSSISVDKTMISGIVVSRIIFNLVSESEISVNASSDRKLLTVTFGGSAAPAVKPEPIAEPKAEPKPETPQKTVTKAEPQTAPAAVAGQEDDPLGLDDPAAKTSQSAANSVPAPTASGEAVAAAAAAAVAAPTVMRIPKLEPVVPVAASVTSNSAQSIKEVTTGASYIEIRTAQPVADYKVIRISGPERLIIDIPCAKTTQKAKTVPVNKFGVAKARIGVSPKNIRVVVDGSNTAFPAYTVTNSADGIRINFK